MTFRTAARAVVTVSLAFAGCACVLSAQAQTPPDSQWRITPTTLSTLLQDGYKIVAVVNSAHGTVGSADTIFVQRDQSAFKCIDPQQPDGKTKAPVPTPACFELVPPSGTVPPSDSK